MNPASIWSDSEGNWYRRCPSCDKELKYTSIVPARAEMSARSAHNRNSLCSSCCQKTDNIAMGKIQLQEGDSRIFPLFKICPSCNVDIPFSSDFTKEIADRNPNWQCYNCNNKKKTFTLPCANCSRLIGFTSIKEFQKASDLAQNGVRIVCIRCKNLTI